MKRKESFMTVAAPRRGTSYPLSVAPMMDRTDRHYRRFMREITSNNILSMSVSRPKDSVIQALPGLA